MSTNSLSNNLKTTITLNSLDFFAFKLGLLIYLYISFIRGFIYVGVAYLSPLFSNIVVASAGVLPLFGLFIPSKWERLWNSGPTLALLIWFAASLIPDLALRMVFIIIGGGLTYGSFRSLIQRPKSSLTAPQFSNAILYFVLIDTSLRVGNRGIDPIIVYNIPALVLYSLLFLLFLAMLRFAHLVDEPVTAVEQSTKVKVSSFFGIISLFLLIMQYFIHYANPGTFTLSLVLTSSIATFITVTSLVISAVVAKFLYDLPVLSSRYNQLILTLMATGLTFSGVYFFPFYGFHFIFYILGAIGVFYLMMRIFEIVAGDFIGISSSLSIVLGVIITLGIGLQLVTVESLVLHLIIPGLAAVFALFAYFLKESR